MTWYINGRRVDDKMKKMEGSFLEDRRTLLTIGKTNEKNNCHDFGRFRMDSFVIYYKSLTQSEISTIYGEGKGFYMNIYLPIFSQK